MALLVRHVMMMSVFLFAGIFLTKALSRTLTWRLAGVACLLAIAPTLVLSQVWSTHNREVLGIEATRSLGQHLHLWRGPAIISRATGEDRWAVRERLDAAIPDEIAQDPAKRDAYQRRAFLDIVAEHPGAFVVDTAIGALKVLTGPSQGPLQRFFPNTFREAAGNVDFIGIDGNVWSNIQRYGADAVPYFLLLTFSVMYSTFMVAGLLFVIYKIPEFTNYSRWTALSLLLVLAYFLVLSSSTSLDARFRTPFSALMALLATLGWGSVGRDLTHWCQQSGPRKLAHIALTILASRNSVAYRVIVYKALGVIAYPIDFLLSLWRAEATDRADKAGLASPIIVLGNHRSGTTVLAQLLQTAFPVAPLGNLSSILPSSPAVYFIFRLMKPPITSSNRNFYGFSSGFFGVSDCYGVWDRWFGTDHSHPHLTASLDDVAADIRSFFDSMNRAAGSPVLTKNNRATLSAAFLAQTLPSALFIYIERDTKAVRRSVLKANRDFYGDDHLLWGLRPSTDFPRKAQAGKAEELVALQQRRPHEVIERELDAIPSTRLIRISFEDLVSNDATTVRGLIAKVATGCGLVPQNVDMAIHRVLKKSTT